MPDVESQRACRKQRALEQRIIKKDRFPSLVERHVGDGDGESQQEKRQRLRDVGGRHPALFPPVPDQQRHRQGDDDGFAQQAEDEQRQRQDVMCAPLRFHEAEVGEHGREVEQGRQHVLAPDDPDHRLRVQRMHRKQRRRKPRARHRQPKQQAPQQQRYRGVQQQVDEVVAERIEPPEFVFQPEGGVEHWPVVAFVGIKSIGVKPDLCEAEPVVNRPPPA